MIMFFVLFGLNLFLQVEDFNRADLGNHYYTVEGRVSSAIDSDAGQLLILDGVSIKGNVSGNLKYKVRLTVQGKSSYDVGDVISFEGYLFDRGLDYEQRFNADGIHNKEKYATSVSSESITKIW